MCDHTLNVTLDCIAIEVAIDEADRAIDLHPAEFRERCQPILEFIGDRMQSGDETLISIRTDQSRSGDGAVVLVAEPTEELLMLLRLVGSRL